MKAVNGLFNVSETLMFDVCVVIVSELCVRVTILWNSGTLTEAGSEL